MTTALLEPLTAASPRPAGPADAGRSAVADLLVLYGDEIEHAARQFTRTTTDADDLAQDVRARALSFAGRFERGTNFVAWIRTMTRNLAINRSHAAARRPRAASALGEDFSIDDAPAPAAASRASAAPSDPRSLLGVREDVSDPVLRAVEDLPERYRDVLLLWAIGELEYREIAARLGCPVGTVMSRLHRARRLLRLRLGGAYSPA